MQNKVNNLVVDTTAFLQNASLQNIGTNIFTTQDVVDEIKNKRQLRRLVVLPYDLQIKDVFPENIKMITEFSKKTGDYPSLSATDISVMALTYQLEKETNGTDHLRKDPLISSINILTKKNVDEAKPDVTGFFTLPLMKDDESSPEEEENEDMIETIENLKFDDENKDIDVNNILVPIQRKNDAPEKEIAAIIISDDKNEEVEIEVSDDEEEIEEFEQSDDEGWITPKNVQKAKQLIDSDFLEAKEIKVACITTDFAMQNVLKQINLQIVALDGRVIKQLRTFILRCYTCFKTTSIMTKAFCPKCGNNTLKRVAVSLDQNGQQVIHINSRRPLTGRGKKFSLPLIKGGKHSNNPLLVEDQPIPDQRPTRLAGMKNNPLNDDYIAGYSPFIMRDINSKSAQLKIRPGTEIKHWMKKNPNEPRRKRK